MKKSVRERLGKAKLKRGGTAEARARRLLGAFLSESTADDTALERDLSAGRVATQIGRIALSVTPEPQDLACASGCAFCCILSGDDGGTITRAEAEALHAALSPFAGAEPGSDWHPDACSALDPKTKRCRAYAVRPMICRSYVSRDAAACEKVAAGEVAAGPGVRGPYADYLTAHSLARAALGPGRAQTYSMKKITAAALAGADLSATLNAAQHRPRNLEDERQRVTRETGFSG